MSDNILDTVMNADTPTLRGMAIEQAGEIEQLRAELAEQPAAVDQLARLFETLCDLVRMGSMRAAVELVREVDAGVVGSAVKEIRRGNQLVMTGWAVQHVTSAFAEHLDAMGARNHAVWTMTFPDGRRLDLTAQWAGAVTVADRIDEAERGRDEAIANAEGAFHRGAEAMRDAAVAECEQIAAARDPHEYEPDCVHDTIGRGRCSRCDSALACINAVRGIAFRPAGEGAGGAR